MASAVVAAVIVAVGLGCLAHDYFGMTRADLREDALLGAGAVFAFVALGRWGGGDKAGQ
jgi:uncharacterized membrane protein